MKSQICTLFAGEETLTFQLPTEARIMSLLLPVDWVTLSLGFLSGGSVLAELFGSSRVVSEQGPWWEPSPEGVTLPPRVSSPG